VAELGHAGGIDVERPWVPFMLVYTECILDCSAVRTEYNIAWNLVVILGIEILKCRNDRSLDDPFVYIGYHVFIF